MNILYLGKFGSHATESYVTHSLRDLGHTVDCFKIHNGVYKELKAGLDQYGLVLFSKPYVKGCMEFLDLCRDRGILTVCWQWDLYWGYRSKKPPQFHADLLFTTDGGHRDKWGKHYPRHRVLRQGIHQPLAYVAPRTETHEVGFIGGTHQHPGRREMIDTCRRHYRFVQHTHVRGAKLNTVLSDIKVVVGDSYPSPRYWSNRIYEMLGRGAFFLHPETEGLDEEFEDGTHYVSFRRGDHEDLRSKIDFYLAHPEKRLGIARQGFEHVSTHYTYHTRCRYLLEQIRKALDCSRAS